MASATPASNLSTSITEATDEELLSAIAKGRKTVLALEMADLADMRVASQYPSYGDDAILDRNFRQIQKVRTVLGAAIVEAKSRGIM